MLAFLDDDARADSGWLANAAAVLDANPDVLAVGGPDPAPDDSTPAELMSDTLLATRWIGSGVAAHENRRGTFDVNAPSDVALVNLVVRRSAFTGFDESIGYIGEDTALIESLLARGRVVYSDRVRVTHRRRAFPAAYLRQRWRYRVKTGELLVRGSRAHRSRKVQAFLVAGTLGILLFPIAVIPYVAVTLLLGARATRLPMRYWPLIPGAFALHHAAYYFGIVWGGLTALVKRRR